MSYINDMVSFVFDETSAYYAAPSQERAQENTDIFRAFKMAEVRQCWESNVQFVERMEWKLNAARKVDGSVRLDDVLEAFDLNPTRPQKDILNWGWNERIRLKIAGKSRIKNEGIVIDIYPKIKKLEEKKDECKDRGFSHLVRKMRALFQKRARRPVL